MIVLKKEKNVSIKLPGDVVAVVGVVVASEEIVEVSDVVGKMKMGHKNAGTVAKKDIWLSNVKNQKDNEKTEEVQSLATIAKVKVIFLVTARKKEL